MLTSISVPTDAAVKTMTGASTPPSRWDRRRAFASASCHDVPARSAAGCVSAAVQRTSTGARVARPSETRMPLLPEVAMASYGSLECAVTVIVTTAIATP